MKRALGWVVNSPYLNSEFPLVCFNSCVFFCVCGHVGWNAGYYFTEKGSNLPPAGEAE